MVSLSLPAPNIHYSFIRRPFIRRSLKVRPHGCQMAIARFIYCMCLALRASGLWLRYATLQSLIPTTMLAQSKERKGSNFAVWQPCTPPLAHFEGTFAITLLILLPFSVPGLFRKVLAINHNSEIDGRTGGRAENHRAVGTSIAFSRSRDLRLSWVVVVERN